MPIVELKILVKNGDTKMLNKEDKKDPTKIEFCSGMTWAKAEKWLKSNAHMLALGKDENGLAIAKTVMSYENIEVATAELTAKLALKANGLQRFAGMAVKIYGDLANELLERKDITEEGRKRAKTLKHAVFNMSSNTAWASCFVGPREFEWPIKMSKKMWADYNKRAGLANIMLFISIGGLEKESTTGLVAANGIMRFLQNGLEEKQKETV